MNGLLVVLLTAVPVVTGMVVGHRYGGGRASAWVLKQVVSWGSGVALMVYGYLTAWTWPAGLTTPLLAGLLLTWLVQKMLPAGKGMRRSAAELGFLQRTSGGVLGGMGGFALAVVGWQVFLFVASLAAPPESAPIFAERPAVRASGVNPFASLAAVAHRGFIKHLPGAGPVSDEMLATADILKTPHDVRRGFAEYKQWDSLADLASFQAIARSDALLSDIDRAGAGNLAALYRLQKDPLIIAFFHEQELQAIISDIDVLQIADELATFQSERAKANRQ